MKKLSLLIALGLALPLASYAQSAKVTAKVGQITVIPQPETWTIILQQEIKTANMKDLFITPSLETGLYTQTKVSSKGTVDTQSAFAGIEVRVLVDGQAALPGLDENGKGVIYDQRTQTLTALFQGICTIDTTTGALVCNDPETLDLVLETMAAHSFNFIAPDVPSGWHTVEVQAKITTTATTTASAKALIGRGSVTIESVRMIRNEDVILD